MSPVINIYHNKHGKTRGDFTNEFQSSWANSLLPHHPEYDRLMYSETVLQPSFDWISDFLKTETFADALSKNYIVVSTTQSTADFDPFYAIAVTLKSGMSGKVNNDFKKGLSMWKIAYGQVKYRNVISDAGRGDQYALSPPLPFADLTTFEKDEAWKTFRNLYAAERDLDINSHINTVKPLADDAALIAQGYKLHFPATNRQIADQNKWDWYPYVGGAPPVNVGLSPAAVANQYMSRCQSYVPEWKRVLLNCPAIRDRADRDAVVLQIILKMLDVCQKGSDPANEFGSSTVPSGFPADGSPRSFEQIIGDVLGQGAYTEICNPFIIDFPKPHGLNPTLYKPYITSLDACTCERFSTLKSEASTIITYAAGPGSGISLEALNVYLRGQYGDTLSRELFDALQHCNARTDLGVYVLQKPLVLPDFLKCGAESKSNCLTCGYLGELTQEFKRIFTESYNTINLQGGQELNATSIRNNVLYAKFLNSKTGFDWTWQDYATAINSVNCDLNSGSTGATANLIVALRELNRAAYLGTNTIEFVDGFESEVNAEFYAEIVAGGGNSETVVACRPSKPLNEAEGITLPAATACERVMQLAIASGQLIYQARMSALAIDFENAYRAKCLNLGELESFSVTYTASEYHYTLYYYDQAGNVVQTVPPKGVNPDFSVGFLDAVTAARSAGNAVTPVHGFRTGYHYNSLNQVVAQQSPDGGKSEFWYDLLGRLVVSQNAQQLLDNKYSYTKYDPLGRIIEVGQKPQTDAMSQAISQDPTILHDWVEVNGGVREQLTLRIYNIPNSKLAGLFDQENLRNRVSYSATKNSATDQDFYTATYYTYDIHGNVRTLLQDYLGIPEMASGNQYKKIYYDYDVISGKVNKVHYQPGFSDAFHHKYEYDSENRLKSVETSRDEIVWERDASYSYYKHGPLARTTLGHLNVQGMDYAYTLQGWLKGVNSTNLDPGTDIGSDGTDGSVVAKDALGFALHYYDDQVSGTLAKDFKPVAGNSPFANVGAVTGFSSLYNGNIAGMTVNNGGLVKGPAATTNPLPLFYKYQYDQLNRLVSMRAHKGLNVATNQWSPISINDYAENVNYDPNGNIKTYLRKGAPSAGMPENMDDLTYGYYANTNQLQHVGDNTTFSSNYPAGGDNTVDLENQDEPNNYLYDAIGNLKSDDAENLTGITWTVYGKIRNIVKSGSTISYTYDASGNRITKKSGNVVTIYVKDAQGNTMSVYENLNNLDIKQVENYLYGSSRLGVVRGKSNSDVPVPLQGGYYSALSAKFTRGEKDFEMSNHLGNVLVTLSEQRTAIDANSDGIIDGYQAMILSAQDYYSFGMIMPGRTVSTLGYRYGFNGQEKSDEIKGKSSSYTAPYWEFDPRLGRRWNLDPVMKPWQSDYATFSNSPIWKLDPNGADDFFNADGTFAYRTKQGTSIKILSTNGVKLFSQVLPNNPANIKALARVVAHYAPSAGIPKETKVGISPNSDKKALAFTNKDGIMVMAKNGVSKYLDDYNNFINVLLHEENHRKEGDPEKGRTYKFSDHTMIYERQMADKTFSITTLDFKVATATSYVSYLLGALQGGEIDDETFDSKIDVMNKKLKAYNVTIFTQWSSASLPAMTVKGKNDKGDIIQTQGGAIDPKPIAN